MNSIQKAIFPAILAGSFAIIGFSSWVSQPQPVEAAFDSPSEKLVPTIQTSEPEVESCQVTSAYPESVRRWCDIISQEAAEQHLDPNFIAAVMLQESGGDAQAYSPSGAVGLLQVMPRDGLAARFECINGPCFASRPSMDELFDPVFNIEYGVRMLAGLVEREGSLRDGLMAYGPMDVGYSYADRVLAIYESYR